MQIPTECVFSHLHSCRQCLDEAAIHILLRGPRTQSGACSKHDPPYFRVLLPDLLSCLALANVRQLMQAFHQLTLHQKSFLHFQEGQQLHFNDHTCRFNNDESLKNAERKSSSLATFDERE